jgi:hypothetical protein
MAELTSETPILDLPSARTPSQPIHHRTLVNARNRLITDDPLQNVGVANLVRPAS